MAPSRTQASRKARRLRRRFLALALAFHDPESGITQEQVDAAEARYLEAADKAPALIRDGSAKAKAKAPRKAKPDADTPVVLPEEEVAVPSKFKKGSKKYNAAIKKARAAKLAARKAAEIDARLEAEETADAE
jgi:hypothetical protein